MQHTSDIKKESRRTLILTASVAKFGRKPHLDFSNRLSTMQKYCFGRFLPVSFMRNHFVDSRRIHPKNGRKALVT